MHYVRIKAVPPWRQVKICTPKMGTLMLISREFRHPDAYIYIYANMGIHVPIFYGEYGHPAMK